MKLFSLKTLIVIAIVLIIITAYSRIKNTVNTTKQIDGSNSTSENVLLALTVMFSLWLLYDKYKALIDFKFMLGSK
jgi:hypothetical protein